MDNDEILFERAGYMATITINRPDKLNTLTVAMSDRICSLYDQINADDDIRVVLILGAGGRAFCAGSDVSSLSDFGTNWQMRNRSHDYALDLLRVRKPVVAAVHGYCIGGGLELAMASDIRLASPKATFSAGEIKLGWHGGSGQTQLLPRLVGYGKALQMLLTGDFIDASEAHRIGLVQELVEEDRLIGRCREIAERIARNPPIAIQLTKHLVRDVAAPDLHIGLAYENDLFSYCMMTEDSKEGIAAFMERRPPRFRAK